MRLTERLVLRRWVETDRDPFAQMNADPEVMAYFPGLLSREESDSLVDRIEAGFEAHGFGLWRHSGLRRRVHPGGRGRLAPGPARMG